jgi:hypothetical protein
VAKKVMETQGGQCLECLEYLIKLAQKSITKKTFLKLFMVCNRRNSIKQLEQLQFMILLVFGVRIRTPYSPSTYNMFLRTLRPSGPFIYFASKTFPSHFYNLLLRTEMHKCCAKLVHTHVILKLLSSCIHGSRMNLGSGLLRMGCGRVRSGSVARSPRSRG